MDKLLNEFSHRRYNPLTGEWVLVSPHRTKRPWQGQKEVSNQVQRPTYDAECYLCPGNIRANKEVNPDYNSTYVFPNDFPAINEKVTEFEIDEGLIKAKSESGLCKVICFSPRHDLTLPQLSIEELVDVIKVWSAQYAELGAYSHINHVQIFENKGAVMGCSNPHPHGQIWAQESIPVESEKKGKQQFAYYKKHSRTLLEAYLNQEIKLEERVLFQNQHMIVLIPFWAVWPYEAMIIPKRGKPNLVGLTEDEQCDFAEALKWITIKYDNLFGISFPYSSGIHQSPTDGQDHPEWHWHMSFYPPLLRSESVKKFMVGYEMFANPQRDITPEQAAETLRNLPERHYLG